MASPVPAGGAILLSGMVPAVWIEQTTYRLQRGSSAQPRNVLKRSCDFTGYQGFWCRPGVSPVRGGDRNINESDPQAVFKAVVAREASPRIPTSP
jgi:hypothetical protein